MCAFFAQNASTFRPIIGAVLIESKDNTSSQPAATADNHRESLDTHIRINSKCHANYAFSAFCFLPRFVYLICNWQCCNNRTPVLKSFQAHVSHSQSDHIWTGSGCHVHGPSEIRTNWHPSMEVRERRMGEFHAVEILGLSGAGKEEAVVKTPDVPINTTVQ